MRDEQVTATTESVDVTTKAVSLTLVSVDLTTHPVSITSEAVDVASPSVSVTSASGLCFLSVTNLPGQKCYRRSRLHSAMELPPPSDPAVNFLRAF